MDFSEIVPEMWRIRKRNIALERANLHTPIINQNIFSLVKH